MAARAQAGAIRVAVLVRGADDGVVHGRHSVARAASRLVLGLVLASLLGSSRAAGQSLPMRLRIDPVLAGGESVRPYALDVRQRERQGRARSLIAAGSGFTLSALAALAYVAPLGDPCFGSTERRGKVSVGVAATTGTLGLAAIIGGVSWLRAQTRAHGRHDAPNQRRSAIGIGILTFVLSQALIGGIKLGESICHS